MFEIGQELSEKLKDQATVKGEACGYVIREPGGISFTIKPFDGSCHPENFYLTARDWIKAKAEGEIVGIWHTHPDDSPPSEADVKMGEAMKLPVLTITADRSLYVVDPGPLFGNQFRWNEEDCYTCAMRFYQRLGIYLRHYVRWPGFYLGPDNVLLDNFEKEGFFQVDGKLLPGDALLVSFASPNTNHCAMIDEDGMIVHHKPLRLSIRERCPFYYQSRGIHIRHEMLC